MANRNYERGRKLEYRTMEILEGIGETSLRMAGSHGLCDVVSISRSYLRLVQVKSGSATMTPAEREAFKNMPCPANTIKQIWTWKKVKGAWKHQVKDI